DLRDPRFCAEVLDPNFAEIFQLAADMGGAGYVFTGENDANVMHNSAAINLNIADLAAKRGTGKIFYASSACIYPEYNQLNPDDPKCSEDSAYPAMPDSEYGWEKLFSERMFMAYTRNYGLDARIARFHNIYGPDNSWDDGREKAPAAICRKVAQAQDGAAIEVWGDGLQTRSFLYIDDCLDGVRRLMDSDFAGPVNIGSEEMISINDFTRLIIELSGKELQIKNITGPVGVRGRNSDNREARAHLQWEPQVSLAVGIARTYGWVESQVAARVQRKTK
ncbi:MAG TPA: NAD-dependent epimerase/dehydratase family protein, partial [Bacteroidetes bacterium]|nr:NAD-dependent epimerase/dehydratase family protein [Bacteroidota bacterium]